MVRNVRVAVKISVFIVGGTLSRLFSSGHHNFTSSHSFDDFERVHHGDCGINFGAVALKHRDHGFGGEVEGFSSEVIDDLQGLRAFVGIEDKLDEEHLLDDGVLGAVLEAVNDIDELVHLFNDLLEPLRVPRDAERHARELAATTLRDYQRINIEAPA